MWDERRDHALVFNGEIYNHRLIRDQLIKAGHSFTSHHSDTEVLVHGFEEWRESLFERLNGMFALAIWDRRAKRLIVARDRMGEKPLYIGQIPGGYAVASEVKALFAHPGLSRKIDRAGVADFLSFDFTLAPKTLLTDVSKLPAAHYAQITIDSVVTHAYWKPTFPVVERSEAEVQDELDELLDRAVRARIEADVPVALLLSGGLDSSTVGWYMRRHNPIVSAYSIGFGDDAHDETEHARIVAATLGIQHHVEVLSSARVLDYVADIADFLDEPMADQSILPMLLLSQIVGGHVKVALGGDGADELLMGYRTFSLLRHMAHMDRIPQRLRDLAPSGVAQRSAALAGGVPRGIYQMIAATGRSPVDRLLAWRGSFAGCASPILADGVAVSDGDKHTQADALLLGLEPRNHDDAVVAGYLRGYLQEDILVKVDRASMAFSLEVRAPFLDPELVDFLLSIPAAAKRQGENGKVPLRNLMRNRLPDSAILRRKHGFSVPMAAWLRGPLRPLLTETLSSDAARRGGILNPDATRKLVDAHLSGRADLSRQLWAILVLTLWQNRWKTSLG
jgi:asparagine synthase (glutamine-hydrolysing)